MSSTNQVAQTNQIAKQLAANKMAGKSDASAGKGFGTLFANALTGLSPDAKLSTIQEQLREALNQQNSRKSSEKSQNLNNMAAQHQASQAAIWSQRDYMNQSSASNSDSSLSISASSASSSSASTAQARSSANESNSSNEVKQSQSSDENKASSKDNESKPDDTKSADSKTTDTATAKTDANEASKDVSKQQASASSADGKTTAQPDAKATADNATAQAVKTDSSATAQAQTQADTGKTGDNVQTQKTDSAAVQANAGVGNTNPSPDTKTLPAQASPVAHAQAAQHARGDHGPINNPALMAAQANQKVDLSAELGELQGRKIAAGDKILTTGSNQPLQAGLGLGALGTGKTGLAGQALIKTPVNQPGFVKELAQQINWSIGKNLSTVDIKVNPESFGPMNLRILQKGQQIHITIRTQDQQSATMLTQAVHGLKETMNQNGLQLGQVQIHHGQEESAGTFAQQQSQSQQQNNQNAQSSQNSGSTGNQVDDGSLDTTAVQTATNKPVSSSQSNNGLDLFA